MHRCHRQLCSRSSHRSSRSQLEKSWLQRLQVWCYLSGPGEPHCPAECSCFAMSQGRAATSGPRQHRTVVTVGYLLISTIDKGGFIREREVKFLTDLSKRSAFQQYMIDLTSSTSKRIFTGLMLLLGTSSKVPSLMVNVWRAFGTITLF